MPKKKHYAILYQFNFELLHFSLTRRFHTYKNHKSLKTTNTIKSARSLKNAKLATLFLLDVFYVHVYAVFFNLFYLFPCFLCFLVCVKYCKKKGGSKLPLQPHLKKSYYPQTLLKECKYELKRIKMKNLIVDDLEES